MFDDQPCAFSKRARLAATLRKLKSTGRVEDDRNVDRIVRPNTANEYEPVHTCPPMCRIHFWVFEPPLIVGRAVGPAPPGCRLHDSAKEHDRREGNRDDRTLPATTRMFVPSTRATQLTCCWYWFALLAEQTVLIPQSVLSVAPPRPVINLAVSFPLGAICQYFPDDPIMSY